MEIERVKLPNGHIVYYLKGVYTFDRVAVRVTPKELMALQRWLSEHEAEIVQDNLDNMTADAMREIDNG